MYQSGVGVRKDFKKAAKLFRRATTLGVTADNMPAVYPTVSARPPSSGEVAAAAARRGLQLSAAVRRAFKGETPLLPPPLMNNKVALADGRSGGATGEVSHASSSSALELQRGTLSNPSFLSGPSPDQASPAKRRTAHAHRSKHDPITSSNHAIENSGTPPSFIQLQKAVLQRPSITI